MRKLLHASRITHCALLMLCLAAPALAINPPPPCAPGQFQTGTPISLTLTGPTTPLDVWQQATFTATASDYDYCPSDKTTPQDTVDKFTWYVDGVVYTPGNNQPQITLSFSTEGPHTVKVVADDHPYYADDLPVERQMTVTVRLAYKYTYDKNGNRATMMDARGTTTYEYDILNRLTKVTEPDGKWIAYEYDANSNKTKMTVHSDSPAFEHVTQYQYSDSGLLSQVTAPNNGIITYTYWDNGALKRMNYPNGIHADYEYNERGWVTSLVHKRADGTVVAGFSYSYDPNTWGNNGTPTSIVEDLVGPNGNIHGEVSYAYDDLYRLTGEVRTGSSAYSKAYAYDGNGNRLLKVDNGTTYYHYNTADRLMDYGTSDTPPYVGNTALTYDDAGNLLTGGGRTYTYTLNNLLASVTHQGVQNPSAMTWDADGNRVSFTNSTGGTEQSVYDTTAGIPAVSEEITPTGPVCYVRTPSGRLIARIAGSGASQTTRYYHSDVLGSEEVLTGENGASTDCYAYDAWGNILSHSGELQQPYQYVGQLGYYTHYQDANLDLLQLGVRPYDPALGRFTQADPAGLQVGSSYNYAMDRPLVFVDPSGANAECPQEPLQLPGYRAIVGAQIIYGMGFVWIAWHQAADWCQAHMFDHRTGRAAFPFPYGPSRLVPGVPGLCLYVQYRCNECRMWIATCCFVGRDRTIL